MQLDLAPDGKQLGNTPIKTIDTNNTDPFIHKAGMGKLAIAISKTPKDLAEEANVNYLIIGSLPEGIGGFASRHSDFIVLNPLVNAYLGKNIPETMLDHEFAHRISYTNCSFKEDIGFAAINHAGVNVYDNHNRDGALVPPKGYSSLSEYLGQYPMDDSGTLVRGATTSHVPSQSTILSGRNYGFSDGSEDIAVDIGEIVIAGDHTRQALIGAPVIRNKIAYILAQTTEAQGADSVSARYLKQQLASYVAPTNS